MFSLAGQTEKNLSLFKCIGEQPCEEINVDYGDYQYMLYVANV